MKEKFVPSKRLKVRAIEDPEDAQDELENGPYSRHDHGGREHGHDWDDWLRADRALKSKDNRKKGAIPSR